MKHVISILSVLILAVFLVPVLAQGHAAHHPAQQAVQPDTSSGMTMMKGKMMQGKMMGSKAMMKGGKMHGGMMGGKGMMGHMGCGKMMGMHGPMMGAFHTIHHLPDLQKKLNLNDDQVQKLKSIRAVFLKNKIDREAEIQKKKVDLDMLIDKNASPAQVRKVLKGIFDAKLELQVSAYETSQKMLGVLTLEQREQFKGQKKKCMMGMMGGMMEGMKGGMKGSGMMGCGK
ncbi:MAG: hypothetical protein GXO78_00530 [Calditrichaeota bacterium]|nr:hypothetical protein [Calditrichota bacterium]